MHIKPRAPSAPGLEKQQGSLALYDSYIEEIRKTEFPLLSDRTYLDHAGTALYSKTLVERFSKDLLSNIYGNPHSGSDPSARSADCVEKVREQALRFFNADPEEFDLVFVANASAAVKLVADAFRDASSGQSSSQDSPGFWYGWHRDAHTSIVGLREISNGPYRCFRSDDDVQKWIDGGCNGSNGPLGLFAFPGQSNMTGRRLPLKWSGQIRKTQIDNKDMQKTYTLLDAAALATTFPLDFRDAALAPDFTALSFYKIFGFPDLGALIVRKGSASHLLAQRRYFGGGTVEMVISLTASWHARKTTSVHDACEDGTLPFHSIVALGHAIDVHASLFGSMQRVSAHTARLTAALHAALLALRHPSTGTPVCTIYNDTNDNDNNSNSNGSSRAGVFGDATTQGATLALNLHTPDGVGYVGYADVERAANARGLYVRSGSLCNPGGMATHLRWSAAEMRAAYAAGHRCSAPVQLVAGRPTGVVRVSLGAMSTMGDVRRWVEFVESVYVRGGEASGGGGRLGGGKKDGSGGKEWSAAPELPVSPGRSLEDWRGKEAEVQVEQTEVAEKRKTKRWRSWLCWTKRGSHADVA
ncbi:MAG: hypothetical protein M1821_000690 [Bathelium mastoideum]|nr:MAG: hypothetical protein M1821_000690 [Bathelium mastoideum]